MKVRGNRWWGNVATEEEDAALPVYLFNKVLFLRINPKLIR